MASGGPSSVRTHSRPVTTPFAPSTRTGCVCHKKDDGVLLGELIFVGEGGHFRFAAAVDQIDGFGAEAARGGDHVDGGVPRADAGDAAADFDFVKRLNFCLLDEFDRAANAVQIFAGKREVPCFAEADADEDGVELLFEFARRRYRGRLRFSGGISRPAASRDRFRGWRLPRAAL